MKRPGTDWFRFAHDDMWDSGEIIPLDFTLSEAGLFLFLSGLQNKFDGLPGHEDTVAQMCRRWPVEFKKAWPRVQALFERDDEGRRRTAWMTAEMLRADTARGAEAAKKRNQRGSKRGVSRGSPKPSQGSPRESSLGEGMVGEVREGITGALREPAKGDHPALIQHWESEWHRTRGSDFKTQTKDGVAMSKVLKLADGSLAEAKARATRLLESTDGFDLKNASPGLLLSRWNNLAATNGHHRSGEVPLFDAAAQRKRREG